VSSQFSSEGSGEILLGVLRILSDRPCILSTKPIFPFFHSTSDSVDLLNGPTF